MICCIPIWLIEEPYSFADEELHTKYFQRELTFAAFEFMFLAHSAQTSDPIARFVPQLEFIRSTSSCELNTFARPRTFRTKRLHLPHRSGSRFLCSLISSMYSESLIDTFHDTSEFETYKCEKWISASRRRLQVFCSIFLSGEHMVTVGENLTLLDNITFTSTVYASQFSYISS